MMARPFDLMSTITASGKTHDAYVSVRGAIVGGGQTDALLQDADARLHELANAAGYFLDPIDEAAGKPSLAELQEVRARYDSADAAYWLLSVLISIEHLDAGKAEVAIDVERALARLDDDTARSTVEGVMAGHDAMVDALAGER